MWQFLTTLFAAIKQGLSLGEKLAPSEKIQEEKFQIKRDRFEILERERVISKAIVYMDLHPTILPQQYIDLTADGMESEDRKVLLEFLSQKYNKRVKRHLKYYSH